VTDHILERVTFQILHDDKQRFVAFFEIINIDNMPVVIKMMRHGDGSGFVMKALQKIRVQCHIVAHHFNHHGHIQARVDTLIDDAKSAASDNISRYIFTDGSIGCRPATVQSVCHQLGDEVQQVGIFVGNFIELIFAHNPEIHIRFRFNMGTARFSGQNSQSANDIPLAVVIHRVQFAIFSTMTKHDPR